MSAELIEAIQSELSGGSLSAIAGAIGAPEEQTRSGVAAALPMLLGALTKNASQPEGAASLAGALERDQTAPLAEKTSSLGGLGGLLQTAISAGVGGKALDGGGMLQHIFGGQQEQAADAISSQSGLGTSQVMQLLMALAPIVMSSLGTVKQDKGMDAQGLAGFLQQQTQALGGQQGCGLLGSIVDPAQDGFGADDLARVGGMLQKSGVLGKLFG